MKRLSTMLQHLLHLLSFVKRESSIALVIVIFRGLTEGVGLLFIIPLLSIAGVTQIEASNSQLIQWVNQSFETLGISVSINSVLVIYFIVMTCYALLSYAQSVNTTKISQRVVLEWRAVLFKRITFASWHSIQQIKRSELQEILTTEIKRFAVISNSSVQFIGTMMVVLVYLILSFFLSFQLTLLSILPIGLLLVLNRPINKKTYTLGETAVKHNKAMNTVILEHLSALKLVKSYQKEEEHVKGFREQSSLVEKQNLLFIKTSGKTKFLFELLASLVVIAYIYVALMVLDIPVSEVLVLIFIFARLLPKVSKLVNSFQQILNALPSFETTITVIEQLEEKHETETGKLAQPLEHGINFHAVSFSYDEKEVIRQLSLSIKANKTTVILGPSGVGKSTLVDIISGFHQPESGEITIDGIPLHTINQTTWKNQITLVPQEAFLFHDSILQNLLWAKADATTQEIEKALQQAGIFETVQNFPNGIETIVGDRGTQLSGGERQRIALARALLRQPQLLILDEATNAVDDQNELLIKEALAKLNGTMTILIIAHRSKLVELADELIQL